MRIHYRFDCEVGQDLGREVAAYTLEPGRGAEPSPFRSIEKVKSSGPACLGCDRARSRSD